MSTSIPTTLDEVLDALDEEVTVIAGGTDLMVGINAGRSRPQTLLPIRAVPALRGWHTDGEDVVISAGTTYTDLLGPDLTALIPGLAQASRTVGSPPIRNAGTIGGNIVTASPAGDTLPVLTALDARLILRSAERRRELSISEFITGPKETQREPRELLTEIRIPKATGPQEFIKVGPRNAMVIAVASFALTVDTQRETVGCALGSVGPVPIKVAAAEDFARAILFAGDAHGTDASEVTREFGRLAVDAARPIDDHRASARYRLTCIRVCAERALGRIIPWLRS